MPSTKNETAPTSEAPYGFLPNGKPKPAPQKIRIIDSVVAVLKADGVSDTTIAKIEEMKTMVSRGTPAADVTIKDDEGNIHFIYCSYHKKWEPLNGQVPALDEEGEPTGEMVDVENFGKAKTPYGYTRVCKEGAKNQNTGAREVRKQKDEVTKNWMAGEVSEEDAKAALAELESIEGSVVARVDGIGFDTKEDAIASL